MGCNPRVFIQHWVGFRSTPTFWLRSWSCCCWRSSGRAKAAPPIDARPVRALRPFTWTSALRRRRRFFNVKQFDIEDQRAVRADRVGAVFAIGEFGGNEQLPLVTHLHELQCFRPAWDHALDGEGGRRAALDRTVENGPVDQRAL